MNSQLIVTTPAERTALTTLERVKMELDINVSTYDDLLNKKIAEATSDIELRCRPFRRETLTETFWPSAGAGSFCTEALQLSRWPVVSITSITVDGETIAAGEYRVVAEGGMVYRLDSSGYSNHWLCSKAAIVVYEAGYLLPGETDPTLPPSLEAAAIELVASYWASRGRDPLVKAEENVGVSRFEYWVGAVGAAGDLPPGVMSKFEPFLLPRFA